MDNNALVFMCVCVQYVFVCPMNALTFTFAVTSSNTSQGLFYRFPHMKQKLPSLSFGKIPPQQQAEGGRVFASSISDPCFVYGRRLDRYKLN